MYTVKRAIIMAAGFGLRMGKLTAETPKPMLKVNGERMIDIIIRGLEENGIREIYIVVGYKKERFQEVIEKFPHVRLIENPYYESCNNISSIYVARDLLEECMIIEGDHYYYSPEPLAREFEHTEYNAYWTDVPTPEWVARVDATGKITEYLDQGAPSGWLLYGVSRWTAEDGRKLKRCLEREFEINQTRDCYWDCVPCLIYPEMFDIYIRETDPGAQVELDSLRELAEIDPTYRDMTEE